MSVTRPKVTKPKVNKASSSVLEEEEPKKPEAPATTPAAPETPAPAPADPATEPEAPASSGAPAEAPSGRVERWVSRTHREHRVLVAPGLSVMFEDYGLDVDLSTEEGRVISKGLHRSGQEGRSLFVLGDAYPESDVGARSEMLRTLRDLPIGQLRSMITIDELIAEGVPANTQDRDTLIVVIMKNKSLKTGGQR